MLNKSETKKRTMLNLAVLIGVLVLILVLQMSGILNSFTAGLLVLAEINIILAVSLNLTTGFLGQLVLGHAGFMSVGAYVSAIVTMSLTSMPIEASLPIGLIAGGLSAGIIGLIIGIPALRLKGDYLAIVTLGFGEIIRVIVENLDMLNRGHLSGIPKLNPISKSVYSYLLAAICVFAIIFIIRSRYGRAIVSIREDEIASEAMGINTTFYKALAFVIAAFFAGIAGGLFGAHLGVLQAKSFGFNFSVEIVIMVVLGGMGSVTGSILSAILLTLLPEFLRDFQDYRMLIYSLILIVMMIFKPSGLMGRNEFSLYNWIKKKFSKKDNSKDKEIDKDKDIDTSITSEVNL